MVDKPGRRKKSKIPWGKIAAVVAIALVAVAAGYFIYETYVYSPPPEYVKLGTSLGNIYLELFPACAPRTVANFVNLADSGFYNNLVWHRIVPGFVIQTGDPNTRNGLNSTRSTWGNGGSNTTVPLEICGWLHNFAGYVGMARQQSNVNSGTSQFYILLDNQSASAYSALEGSYTMFGKVISGMGVACSIAKVPTYASSQQPINPVYVKNATVISAAQAPVPQPLTACKS